MNTTQALQHLALLGKSAHTARLRFIDKAAGGRSYKASFAAAHQYPTCEAYLVVNEGGDRDADITAANAIFCEWDDRPLDWQRTAWQEFGMPAPTFQVATGGKSIHTYWVFDSPCSDIDAWKALQRDLLDHLKADRSIKNPSRIMRLAGGVHSLTGVMSQLEAVTAARYSFDTLRSIIPCSAPQKPLQPAIIAPRRPLNIAIDGSLDPYQFLSREQKTFIDSGLPAGYRNEGGCGLAKALQGIEAAAQIMGATLAYAPRDLWLQALGDRDADSRENVILWESAANATPSQALIAHCEKLAAAAQPAATPAAPAAQKDSPAAPIKNHGDSWDNWRAAKKFTPDIVINQKYLDIAPPAAGEILAVRSGTGTGKSTWYLRCMLSMLGVLFFGYRNSLLLQTAAKIERAMPEKKAYHLQRDLKGDDGSALAIIRDPESTILLCSDSITRFHPSDFDGRDICIDEVESVIPHTLESSTSVSRYRAKAKFLLGEAMRRSRSVTLLDGHARDSTVQYLADLAGGTKSVRKVENTYKGNKGKLQILMGTEEPSDDGIELSKDKPQKISKSDYSPIQARILDNPGRFAVASDSQSRIEILDRMLSAAGRKTLRFDSTTSNAEWAAEFMEDPAAYLVRYQIEVFLYSPSAEAGLDVSLPGYFSDLYYLFFGVIGVDPILQMLARVRDTSARKSVYVAPQGMAAASKITTETIGDRIAAELGQYALDCAAASFAADDEAWITEAVTRAVTAATDRHFRHECELIGIGNFESKHLRDAFLEAAAASGYECDLVIATPENESRDEADEEKQAIRSENAAAIEAARDIDNHEADTIAGDFAALDSDKLALKKYRLLQSFPGIESKSQKIEIKDKATGETKIEERPIFDAKFIERVLYEDRNLSGRLELRWLMLNLDSARRLQRQSWIKKLEAVFDPDRPRGLNIAKHKSRLLTAAALVDLGLPNFLQPGFEWDKNSDEVQAIYSMLKASRRLQRDTGVKPGSAKPIAVIGMLLRKIGLKSKADGKKKDRRYSIAIDPIDDTLFTCSADRLQAKVQDANRTLKVLHERVLIEKNQANSIAHTLPDSIEITAKCAHAAAHTQHESQPLKSESTLQTVSAANTAPLIENEPPAAAKNEPINQPAAAQNQPAAAAISPAAALAIEAMSRSPIPREQYLMMLAPSMRAEIEKMHLEVA